MIITFRDKKLKAAIEDEALCRRQYGTELAKKLHVRMATLAAAVSLADLWPPMSGPERCHVLKGDLDGTFSVDLKHPYRLLFVPTHAGAAPVADEKSRWESIKAIEILDVEDTHG